MSVHVERGPARALQVAGAVLVVVATTLLAPGPAAACGVGYLYPPSADEILAGRGAGVCSNGTSGIGIAVFVVAAGLLLVLTGSGSGRLRPRARPESAAPQGDGASDADPLP